MYQAVTIYLFLIFLTGFAARAQQSSVPGPSRADSQVYADPSSGLMWMRQDFSALEGRFLTHWDECAAWRDSLNRIRFAGYGDWQVPTITAYRTLNRNSADRRRYRAIFAELDTTCVWGKGPYAFWSRNEISKHVASYISFHDGFATSGDKGKQIASGDWAGIPFGFSVRLVRRIR